MKKYLATLVCGFGAGVLQIVPMVKSVSCCLILPLAVFFALILDQRAAKSNSKIPMRKALLFGLFTGLFAALFGSMFEILITFLTKHNDIIASFPQLQKMIEGFPLSQDIKRDVLNLFQSMREDIIHSGFSPLYSLSIIFNNFIVNSIFGIAGGLVAGQLINSRKNININGK